MTADKARLIETLRERIENSDELTEADREVLLKFSNELKLLKQDYTAHRHEKLLRHLTRIGENVGGLADALEDREAAEKIVMWINDTYDNHETNRDYRVALRVFGTRVEKRDPERDGPVPSIAWVSARTPKSYKPTPTPSDMLEWESDVLPMIEDVGTNSRDRALFAVAFEGGFRGGELYDLTVGDVSEHPYGKHIKVDGKTGEREVLVAGDAIAYVNDWMNDHPAKSDPDAPLWSRLTEPEQASYQTFLKYFKRAGERAGVTKPVTPTNFRKSNATWLAKKGMNAPRIEDRQGRERGSKAVARYVARFGTDAEDEYVAKVHGMKVLEEEEKDTTPVECHRCGTLTPHHRDACMKCGLPFDPLEAYEAGSKASKQASMDDFETMARTILKEVLADHDMDTDTALSRLSGSDSVEPDADTEDTTA